MGQPPPGVFRQFTHPSFCIRRWRVWFWRNCGLFVVLCIYAIFTSLRWLGFFLLWSWCSVLWSAMWFFNWSWMVGKFILNIKNSNWFSQRTYFLKFYQYQKKKKKPLKSNLTNTYKVYQRQPDQSFLSVQILGEQKESNSYYSI